MLSLQEVAAALGWRVIGEARIESVGSDSRNIAPGQLFVALRGERFNGHDFVEAAAQQGAAAALVDADWAAEHPQAGLPLLVTEDTRIALGELAAHWRGSFALPLIGVTGSNGKTTVKEMCAAILRAQARRLGGSDADVLATVGNLNNDIGLPLTLLQLRDHHRAAVIEMGMNHPGEIGYLAAIARPTVAIVTNAQRAHLQGMGSVVEIAREKGAIYDGLQADGVAVINLDDPHAASWRERAAAHPVSSFSLASTDADVRVKCETHGLGLRLTLESPAGHAEFDLGVPGEHNARNAAGAATACLAAGASLDDVVAGLSSFTGTPGRLQLKPGPAGALIIDDSYNANPDSMCAAIDVLASTPGHTVLVLGDMGEVGQSSAQLHDEIGGYAKSKGIDALYALGDMSAVAARNFGEGARHFESAAALVEALQGQLDAQTVVLVKGSRFMRMERVANALAAVHNGAPSKESH